MTSHDVVSRLRRLTGIKKIGHTGTLDPNATGLLVLAVGEATKLLAFMPAREKRYRAELCFGITTDTDDVTGRVLCEKDVSALTEAALRETLASFVGESLQVPPMYSARKKNGKKLYEYARAGQVAEVEPRAVFIREIRLSQTEDLPQRAQIEVTCSKGTYIRALIRDAGALLTTGAAMGDLRRLSSDGFALEQACTLSALEAGLKTHPLEAFLIAPEAAMTELPAVRVSRQGLFYLKNGNALHGKNLEEPQTEFEEGLYVRLYAADVFCGIGQARGGKIQPKRLLQDALEQIDHQI